MVPGEMALMSGDVGHVEVKVGSIMSACCRRDHDLKPQRCLLLFRFPLLPQESST
jgi:hypothetical protein